MVYFGGLFGVNLWAILGVYLGSVWGLFGVHKRHLPKFSLLFESSTLASMDTHKVKNLQEKKGVSHKKKKLMQVLVSV